MTGQNGDCWDRWAVRLQEIRESTKIIQQAIESIPSGDLQAKVPKVIKVPKGETYARSENPKGEMGYYLVSDGNTGPYRLKIRSASFSNISILPWILEGVLIPDIIAIMGSLFGYAGWPENGSYGASKAAVINLAESLKLELYGTGVDLTLINPGFVDTPLNASYDPKKKLFVMSKERCARKILQKLPRKPYEIAFPPQVSIFLKTMRSLPRAISFPLIRWFTKTMQG